MPSERIQIGSDFYLLASALAPRRPKAFLSHADGFAVFDHGGDVPLASGEAYGLFHRGTRFLDRWELRLDGEFPLLLSTAASDDGSELVTTVSNADERRDGEVVLERDTIAVQRTKTLYQGVLYERLDVCSYAAGPLTLDVTVLFGADFADEFEVRGVERVRRGEIGRPIVDSRRVCFQYRGLDGVTRRTELTWSPAPQRLEAGSAHFRLSLAPRRGVVLGAAVRCLVGDEGEAPILTVSGAGDALRTRRRAWLREFPTITSSNEEFDAWMTRSLHDIGQLRTEGPPGAYVKAGIPWFATIFGRDGLITALETLAFSPTLAAEVLRTLAALQGRRDDPGRDEEPGKIVHELRAGEMAATAEVPFGRYYGSVDATPLFLVLLGEYVERTADRPLVDELWPAAVAALGWIERHADRDPGGYLTYERRAAHGLVHQGWKDSHDAVSHADGSLAEPPIALAEVQAYVYAALRSVARIARLTGRDAVEHRCEERAARLREGFNRDFWLEDQGTFALALDRGRRPCRVVASNAGHCLLGGIADRELAGRTIARLLEDDVWSGWGIRTLSQRAARFNPMSYHNGSVWPHDNALIAAGFARYGATDRAAQVLSALFDTSGAVEDRRLPELFCGFPRAGQRRPVPYPVACRPQAWAAGSVLLLLQSALGLRIEAWERRLTMRGAVLPEWLERVDIRGLRVGEACVDLRVDRGRFGAAVEVMERHGDLDIVVHK
jgi:glycogen debranching enzyme